MIKPKIRPVVLAILDGWGVAPPGDGNPMFQANLSNFKRFIKNYPAMTVLAAGNEVGLVWGQMGNSEVGHLNIGAGRVYYQTLLRIDREITSGAFFKNRVFLEAINRVRKNKSALHLMGLLSGGNVHSAETHLYALLELAAKEKLPRVFIHAFLDGRDALFNGGLESVKKLQAQMAKLKAGKIASLSGRFYSMDRDNHWDRIEKAYSAIVQGKSEESFTDPLKAIEASYKKQVYDEQFAPVALQDKDKPVSLVEENDAVIFFNFRADRARQLTKAFVLPGFNKFSRPYLKNLFFVTMTEYEKNLPVKIVYPPEIVKNCLAETVAAAGLKQFHIAETEKYAHTTFFLNGLVEEPFPGEDRQIIPSPQVSTFDQKPEMSALEITKRVIKALEEDKYDFIIVNFANADMVGHSGLLQPTIKALETVDGCLGQMAEMVLARGGVMIITADHGNAEELVNLKTGQIDKEHSTNPVPFIVVGQEWEGQQVIGRDALEGDLSLMQPVGLLSDVAPTVLKIMGLEQPKEMTGRSLI
ncbi:MAG: 2,3-bisphosphoglycerate-independent phosphoglycerate mutase [Candidatus Magasanikbacteria bacterium]|nr:2,3-bisphosphoglycerate-independent phosphoglycerate mutase [Candidatus Magasanikbacteria bacterium]